MQALLFALPLVIAGVAHAAPDGPVRVPVTNPREVMFAALDDPAGTAQGMLQGEVADAIGRQFASHAPIHIDVTTEKRYRQPGCSRLRVTFSQAEVHLPHAETARTETITFGVNLCRDGQPPRTLAIR